MRNIVEREENLFFWSCSDVVFFIGQLTCKVEHIRRVRRVQLMNQIIYLLLACGHRLAVARQLSYWRNVNKNR
jgi:hypothetical protein